MDPEEVAADQIRGNPTDPELPASRAGDARLTAEPETGLLEQVPPPSDGGSPIDSGPPLPSSNVDPDLTPNAEQAVARLAKFAELDFTPVDLAAALATSVQASEPAPAPAPVEPPRFSDSGLRAAPLATPPKASGSGLRPAVPAASQSGPLPVPSFSDSGVAMGPDFSQPSFPPAGAPLAAGALKENQLFGKYRVVRDLGAGGMAQVFLAAIDGPEGFQKQCVVKKILPEYARDPNFAKMFVNEARVAAMMSHQNIVQVYEFSRVNDEFFLSMEYVSGASLSRVMRAARKASVPLGARVAVEVGIAMAQALSYAHTFATPDGVPLEIVHRDVSPENILISREGAVKLTDFGVAKSAMTGQHTVAGVVKGKWSYMSPEQVSSKPVDGRADIFSLGIVLYEVSVGRRLFRGDSLPSTVNAVMQAPVLPPSALVHNFPPQLERILMTALERDPAKRFPTAHAFAMALEKFRAGQPWTSGGRHLAGIVNSLFPRDGSQPGANIMPGSGVSQQGVAQPPEGADELPSLSDGHGISIDVQEPVNAPLSPAVLVALGATVVLGSALFWYLLS